MEYEVLGPNPDDRQTFPNDSRGDVLKIIADIADG